MEALEEIRKVLMSEELSAEGMVSEVSTILNNAPKRKKREAQKLTWNKRQYGSGLIAGIGIGICIGLPLDAIMAIAAKWFVTWLTTW